jgi:N-acetylmuramoyl-L-alanine amidase
MAKTHVVVQGETLSAIARKYGVASWRAIYEHADNADFRAKRPNPNIIYPGDELFVPGAEEEEPYRTGARYTFQAQTQRLQLRMQDFGGDALAGKKYQLSFNGETREGTTADDGAIDEKITSSTTKAELLVFLDDEPDGAKLNWKLDIDHLDPIAELSGIQARLNNLCFDSGPVDGIMGPLTKSGVKAFQERYELVVDGIPDRNTKAKLEEIHGC